MSGIVFAVIPCALCFFAFWFLGTDAYFVHARKAEGKVTQVVYGDNGNEGVQYRIHFSDSEEKQHDALSAWYKKNQVVKENDNVSIKYVSFKAACKPVLAVRIQDEALVNDEKFRIFLVAGIIFAAVAVMGIMQFIF